VVEERSVRRRRGGGRCGVEGHAEEERSMRHRRGGGRRHVEADAKEERALTGVWQGNDSNQDYGLEALHT
jgi:hypothetical protein